MFKLIEGGRAALECELVRHLFAPGLLDDAAIAELSTRLDRRGDRFIGLAASNPAAQAPV